MADGISDSGETGEGVGAGRRRRGSPWVGKRSQISDSQEPSPQREAIMAGRGAERGGAACH